MGELHVEGIPAQAGKAEAALCRSRLLRAVMDLQEGVELKQLDIRIKTDGVTKGHIPESQAGKSDEFSLEERAAHYQAIDPLWKLEQLVVPDDLLEELLTAMEVIALEPLVFGIWGLREIEPFPRSVLNFHGAPGTGKTLAAHAVASRLGKKIMVASYAQIESKFHGDGPKNVEALFHAAQKDDAVLFIDEADSLLSRRLTTVTQGSEQAINSMRSQLLICMEKHKGIVVFATNLVENYDPAFETRVRHIHFPLPDLKTRAIIWAKHLPSTLPLSLDVDLGELAARSDAFCGREIKNAVIDTALRVARAGRSGLTQADLLDAVGRIICARKKVVDKSAGVSLNDEMKYKIEMKLAENLEN